MAKGVTKYGSSITTVVNGTCHFQSRLDELEREISTMLHEM